MTELRSYEVLSEGFLRFLALTWPEEEGRTAPVAEALACSCAQAAGGPAPLHPCGFLSLEVLDGGAIADATALVGPSTRVTLPLGTSDEQGAEQPLDVEVAVLLVDFGASVLERLRDLGEDIVAEGIFPLPPPPARGHSLERRAVGRCQDLGVRGTGGPCCLLLCRGGWAARAGAFSSQAQAEASPSQEESHHCKSCRSARSACCRSSSAERAALFNEAAAGEHGATDEGEPASRAGGRAQAFAPAAFSWHRRAPACLWPSRLH